MGIREILVQYTHTGLLVISSVPWFMQVQLLIKGSRCPFSLPPNSFPFPWLTQWRICVFLSKLASLMCVSVELWDRIMNINRNFHVIFLSCPLALPFNFPSLSLCDITPRSLKTRLPEIDLAMERSSNKWSRGVVRLMKYSGFHLLLLLLQPQ